MIAGICPGRYGAIAVLTEAGELVDVFDMPARLVTGPTGTRPCVSPCDVATLLRSKCLRHAYLSRAIPDKDRTATAIFAYGHDAGILAGILAALDVSSTLIDPTAWRLTPGLPDACGRAEDIARRLWPQMGEKVQRFRHAQAALTGLYGLRSSAAAPISFRPQLVKEAS